MQDPTQCRRLSKNRAMASHRRTTRSHGDPIYNRSVPPVGDPSAWMIVGEAPGKRECEQKEPFVGPAGAYLMDVLASLGLLRHEIYITNVVRKWPRTATGRTRRPNAQEIADAHKDLVKDIQEAAPRFILALGATAIKSLTGYCPTVARARESGGQSLGAGFGHTARVLPTYHPSYIRSRPAGKARAPEWKADLARFVAGQI